MGMTSFSGRRLEPRWSPQDPEEFSGSNFPGESCPALRRFQKCDPREFFGGERDFPRKLSKNKDMGETL